MIDILHTHICTNQEKKMSVRTYPEQLVVLTSRDFVGVGGWKITTLYLLQACITFINSHIRIF